jgi:hypothetical protein
MGPQFCCLASFNPLLAQHNRWVSVSRKYWTISIQIFGRSYKVNFVRTMNKGQTFQHSSAQTDILNESTPHPEEWSHHLSCHTSNSDADVRNMASRLHITKIHVGTSTLLCKKHCENSTPRYQNSSSIHPRIHPLQRQHADSTKKRNPIASCVRVPL